MSLRCAGKRKRLLCLVPKRCRARVLTEYLTDVFSRCLTAADKKLRKASMAFMFLLRISGHESQTDSCGAARSELFHEAYHHGDCLGGRQQRYFLPCLRMVRIFIGSMSAIAVHCLRVLCRCHVKGRAASGWTMGMFVQRYCTSSARHV